MVILEQYKLYVEMADRVSARRIATNTFFLTLNTAVAAAVAMSSWNWGGAGAVRYAIIPAALVMTTQCGAWYWLIGAHQRLNSAKYKLVQVMEESLPARLFGAEWALLGEGRKHSLYTPLTDLEKWIPLLFAVIYVVAPLALLLS